MRVLYRCDSCKGPVSKAGTGLGTWHCQRGCHKRRLRVEKFIGCGKENERGRYATFVRVAPIKVEVY
jgi:hypothetical protein